MRVKYRVERQPELKYSFPCSLKNYVSADQLSVSGKRLCSMDLLVASVVRIRAYSSSHFAFYVDGRNITCPQFDIISIT